MWWNVLIIPNGYRYKVKMGEGNLDNLYGEYKRIENRTKIKFTFEKEMDVRKLDYKSSKELNDIISKGREEFYKKHKLEPVSNNILQMMKSTEAENLDVIVNLDAADDNAFSRKYGGDERGVLKMLSDAKEIMLTRSNWSTTKKSLMDDHRYRKLSDEGKKKVLQRAERESRMQDSKKIFEWMERLQASIDMKNKKKKPSEDVYASVFDGLK